MDQQFPDSKIAQTLWISLIRISQIFWSMLSISKSVVVSPRGFGNIERGKELRRSASLAPVMDGMEGKELPIFYDGLKDPWKSMEFYTFFNSFVGILCPGVQDCLLTSRSLTYQDYYILSTVYYHSIRFFSNKKNISKFVFDEIEPSTSIFFHLRNAGVRPQGILINKIYLQRYIIKHPF